MNATLPYGGAPPADDDLYSDGAKPADKPEEKMDEKGEDAADSIEATLPRSILAGKTFEVGDEVVLKITSMHDNEISVKYAPAKEGDEGGKEKAPMTEPEMSKGDPEYD